MLDLAGALAVGQLRKLVQTEKQLPQQATFLPRQQRRRRRRLKTVGL
jgi:hypothetical protein